MKLNARDFVSTLLVLLFAVPFVGFLIRGEMPFIEDTRGLAAVGLVLSTAAYLVLSSGDTRDLADSVENAVALVAFVLGFVAFALAETAAGEALLVVFMSAVLLAWAVKLMDHAGVLYETHPHGGA
jgi:NhaP-type Na+/H+ or K+/H+ antiporter